MTEITQTITYNCGHTFTYALPLGQLSLPLTEGHSVACVDCWNLRGYEGDRYIVAVRNSDEPAPVLDLPERTDGALFGLTVSEVPTDGALFGLVAA